MLDRIAWPSYRSVNAELRKAGLLRILLGSVIFARFFQIFSSYSIYMSNEPIPSTERFGIVAFLFFIACFTAGFLTQLATALVAIGAVIVDHHFSTRTLGTDVLCGVMFVLFLLNSGQRFSIDRLILSRGGLPSKLLSPFQWFGGAHDMRHIKSAYLIGFIFYALLSFVALTYHFADAFWVSGLTTKSLLTNSYLCKYYQFFRDVEHSFPAAMSVFSIFSGLGQSVFQIFMVPLMLWHRGQRFVCFWGFSFFLVSLLTINLSYLPHIELVLWVLLFIPFGSESSTVKIVYDDQCNLCRGSIRTLSFFDLAGTVAYVPASQASERISAWGVLPEEIQNHMVGMVRGKVYRGYDLYVALTKEKVLLWPLLPVATLGTISGLGPAIYGMIASRRRALFGSCEFGAVDNTSAPARKNPIFAGELVRGMSYAAFAASCVLFLLIEAPGLSSLSRIFLSDSKIAAAQKLVHFVGFEPPNVFNEADLSMGDRWLEIYVQTQTQQWELTSLRGREGERLNYLEWDMLNFTNHNSDFLYFGETLRLSRIMLHGIENPTAFFEEGGLGFESISKRIRFDYHKRNRSGPVVYLVQLRANNSSRVAHWQSDPERFKTQLLYHAHYQFDGSAPMIRLPEAAPL